MPATATITAYYSFTAGTKARASQVVANFALYRGHNIPIDPNVAAGANNTYDLGSTEYRWRDVYTRAVDFISSTTTGMALNLSGETTTANPAFVFKIGGIESFRIPQTSSNTTTAAKFGYGEISIATFAGVTGASALIAGSTITISTTGKPILYGIGASGNGDFYLSVDATKPIQANGNIHVLLNGVTVASYAILACGAFTTTAANSTAIAQYTQPIIDMKWVSGSTYYVSLGYTVNNATTRFVMNNGKLWVKEII